MPRCTSSSGIPHNLAHANRYAAIPGSRNGGRRRCCSISTSCPGAADETADDGDFEALRAAFLASEWANRTPTEAEVPFEMAVQDDRVVRGRMDAVFGNAVDGWVVVDWKTASLLNAVGLRELSAG